MNAVRKLQVVVLSLFASMLAASPAMAALTVDTTALTDGDTIVKAAAAIVFGIAIVIAVYRWVKRTF